MFKADCSIDLYTTENGSYTGGSRVIIHPYAFTPIPPFLFTHFVPLTLNSYRAPD